MSLKAVGKFGAIPGFIIFCLIMLWFAGCEGMVPIQPTGPIDFSGEWSAAPTPDDQMPIAPPDTLFITQITQDGAQVSGEFKRVSATEVQSGQFKGTVTQNKIQLTVTFENGETLTINGEMSPEGEAFGGAWQSSTGASGNIVFHRTHSINPPGEIAVLD